MQVKRLSVDIGITGLILTLAITWKRNIWRAISNKNSKHATKLTFNFVIQRIITSRFTSVLERAT